LVVAVDDLLVLTWCSRVDEADAVLDDLGEADVVPADGEAHCSGVESNASNCGGGFGDGLTV